MSDFDLDLGAIEQSFNDGRERRVVLGILDGETPAEQWIETVAAGDVLVLAVEGSLAELAEEFAPAIREADGTVMHFRDFLIVAPADIPVDNSLLVADTEQ